MLAKGRVSKGTADALGGPANPSHHSSAHTMALERILQPVHRVRQVQREQQTPGNARGREQSSSGKGILRGSQGDQQVQGGCQEGRPPLLAALHQGHEDKAIVHAKLRGGEGQPGCGGFRGASPSVMPQEGVRAKERHARGCKGCAPAQDARR